MELKKVKPMFDKLSNVAHEIVESTFDGCCSNIDNLIIGDKTVEVKYEGVVKHGVGHSSRHFKIKSLAYLTALNKKA